MSSADCENLNERNRNGGDDTWDSSVTCRCSNDLSSIIQLPSTFDTIRMDTDHPQPAAMQEFIHTHSGLRKFWMSTKSGSSAGQVPKLLAQYCTRLTHLSLFMYGVSQGFPTMFTGVFPSLYHLKVLEVSMPNCFNSKDLEELCANCPDLEVLMLHKVEIVELTDVMPILKLKKLIRLDLRKFVLTDQSVAALCEGVGATLEYFQFNSNSLTDAPLQAISLHCHNLSDLRFYFYGTENKFTPEGMANFIDAITSHPSWNDSAKNRQLSIASRQPHLFDKVNLHKYGGRVVLKTFLHFVIWNQAGFLHTNNYTMTNNRCVSLVDISARHCHTT